MKKSEKKLISAVLVLSVIASVFSICFNAFANSQKLILNVMYSDSMDGSEDLNWYVYTPEVSGTYSFLSFNRPHSEAYLFTKESDTMGTKRSYTQLAYSSESPDYKQRGQNGSIQFCLTYHLEAGTTYYYAAGWWDSERTNGTMNVKLVCDKYDTTEVESLDLSSNAEYNENSNGSWQTDSNGNKYFKYDLGRIITNLKITVNYKDGTSTTVVGKDEIDGHSVTFTDNQAKVHWYPKGNENYTENMLTVTFLGVSADYNVTVLESGLVSVSFKVVDYTTNEPLKGITAARGGDTAVSDEDGNVTLSLKQGENKITFSGMYAISRDITVNLSSKISAQASEPIGIVSGDYNGDNVINGKDYVYIMRTFTGNLKTAEADKFRKQLDFKKNLYPSLTVNV